ncbi:MAG: ferredoxin [Subtercola sp.]|jgi:2Fe-2S ferredoxin|nr:ferredoxin [Subtercola sp.]
MTDKIQITFRDPAGQENTVSVEPRGTVMEAAVMNNVGGIIAECGGGCSCATCHVYVDPEWFAALPEPDPTESELVEFLEDARPCSRLSCQIQLVPELDGLTVQTPDQQN